MRGFWRNTSERYQSIIIPDASKGGIGLLSQRRQSSISIYHAVRWCPADDHGTYSSHENLHVTAASRHIAAAGVLIHKQQSEKSQDAGID